MTLVQTAPKKIYLGNNELKAVYLGDTKVRPSYPTESIVIKMIAYSNGDLQIPRAGVDTNGAFTTYNWKVSYDGGAETSYSGTGTSNSNITIATGLAAYSEHIITITPVTENYGWARAFGFSQYSGNSIKLMITEVVYDGSYKGYGVSATDTGNYFRYNQYKNCSNLTKIYKEVLPDTVTTIGNIFRYGQYMNCTSLTSTAEEVIPSSVTSVGQMFRADQYNGCTALNEIKGWKDLSISGQYYRIRQYNNCTTNKTVKVLSNVGPAAYDNSLNNSYVISVSVPSAYLSNFVNATVAPRSSITDSKFVGY